MAQDLAFVPVPGVSSHLSSGTGKTSDVAGTPDLTKGSRYWAAVNKVIKLPQLAWHGPKEVELDLPESWHVVTCRMAVYPSADVLYFG